MIQAGNLKYRIKLLQPTTAKNALGQKVDSGFTTLATIWAAKWQLSSKDVTTQAGLKEQASAKFFIRSRDDITTDLIVEFRGEQYKIVGTDESEDHGLYLFVRSIDD